jgi:hypothetical protein
LWINWLSYIPSIKGVNWPVQYINSPNTIPPMSIGLHVWIVHQPKRCVHFIAVHRPLRLAHTSAHAVNLFYCIISAHTYSSQFVIISAHTVPWYGPIRTHCNFCCNRPRSAGSMLSGICTCRGLQCYR